MSSISGTSSGTENGSKYWEKTITDVNNIDETLKNARDLGYTRLNYSRLSAVGKLSKFDKTDIYKTQVQSNGKLAITLRNSSGDDENVLDLSKYDKALEELRKQTDPEGYAKEQEEKKKAEAEKNPLELTAPGMQMQVYTIKNGREVLVADSTAEKDSKEYENMSKILTGEYKATKGEYYVKVSRTDETDKNEEIPYALQITMGKTYKHDYAAIEQPSSDTKNKKESIVPTVSDSTGVLSSANAMQIQAARYQSTAQMLSVGYLNMANVTSGSKGANAVTLFSTLI